MKLLFTHSSRFYQYNNVIYSLALNKQLWESRYLPAFSQVVVIGRDGGVITAETANRMSISSADKVEFRLLPYDNIEIAKLLHHKDICDKIREALNDCDCLIARVPSTVSSLAIEEAKRQGKPYLVEVVGCPWDALWNHSLRGKLLAPFSYLSMKRIVKNAPYAIYVTNEFLQHRYPCSGKWIGCSDVELSSFDDSILEERISKINNHNGKIIIGTTAAVDVRYKGQQNVIKALGRLKKLGNSNFEYHLVGRGNQDYLKSVAEKYNVSDNVKFLGSLPHEQVFSWLDKIDIYVQPSKQEGLPRALIEAMSRGLPAFGARTGGIPELLEEEYIFDNNKNNINQIIKILLNFNTTNLIKQSKRNYMESKKYQKEILIKQRFNFLELLKNMVINKR